MATAEPITPPMPKPAPITSAQPGGGLCMGIELAWGRLRRACLRRFSPAYVRQMQEKRQGDCPGCPHDIIDPRDLKFYRNVCGFSFRDEDDAFRWRGRLGLARMGLAEVLCFGSLYTLLALPLLALLAAGHIWALVFLVPITLGWAEVLYFFRDPERILPTDPDALLSPADGTITDIGEVTEADYPGGRALRIGMFLSVFNVHVNRTPRSGKITNLRYFPGEFLDARHPEVGVRNEQMWIDMEEAGTGRPLRVKQIAGKIARRIVCWLKVGEEVRAGERLGMIKFGSRTEVFLPVDAAVDVLVKVGDKVRGGSTILLRYKKLT
ncbi:MAG: phosphatidylserine decarboxylase [Gemmataceae bacterium]|nr:phosphatidylserine decarboxylase [Gemmataceae bacterium]